MSSVYVPVSGMFSMFKLWGGEVRPTRIPNSGSGYSSPRLRVPNAHSLRLVTRYEFQWQGMISYTYYTTTNTNTTDNEKIKDKRVTNSSAYGTFSYLSFDIREIVIPWHNALRIDHYSLSWESSTTRGLNTYISYPSESCSGFQKRRFEPRAQSWKILKYMVKPLSHSETWNG